MPEVLKAEVKNRRKILLEEDEIAKDQLVDKISPTSGLEEDIPQSRAAQEDKSRMLQAEKEKMAMVEDKIVIEEDIKSMVEEDIKCVMEEDIKSMVEEDIKSMVEEDSSRRGSLLDELREEEEMRLRLLQVVR